MTRLMWAGFYNNFIWGQMATGKAVDHQTRVVTSVMKVCHFPPENPRGRGGKKKKEKEKNTNQNKCSFKIHERGKRGFVDIHV